MSQDSERKIGVDPEAGTHTQIRCRGHRLARRPLIQSPRFLAARSRATGRQFLPPDVTNTKYASEKCFAPLAAPRHFPGSPASPRRITVRRNKRAAHYFYESSRISPEVSEDPLVAFFSTFPLRPFVTSLQRQFLRLFSSFFSTCTTTLEITVRFRRTMKIHTVCGTEISTAIVRSEYEMEIAR